MLAFKNVQQSPELFYREFSQPKIKFGSPQVDKDGSFRMRNVTRPIYSLKVLQREILSQLKEHWLPNCMFGGIEKRNNVENAYQHINGKYFFTIDLKKFFNNISNTQIHQTLIRIGFTWSEARFITNLTTYNNCLPQGAPTSTALANLAFAPTAIILENFCVQNGITFTVFVDDLTFSSPKCFKRYTNQILATIQQDGFIVNHRKIHYRTNCCEITGIVVKKGRLLLPKEILNRQNKPGIKQYVNSVIKQRNTYITELV